MIGGQQQNQHHLNNIPVTSSKQGDPIAVAMGCVKCRQALLFMSSPGLVGVGSQGKGIGSSKSGEQYDYFADVQAAVCNGPILGVSNVWAGQTWIQAPANAENVDGSSGSGGAPIPNPPRYPSKYASLFALDHGAALVNTYGGTYNDYGLSPTTLSGSDLASMVSVPYNYSLTPAQNELGLSSGTYTVSTSLGTFTLSAVANASSGTTVYTLASSNTNAAANGLQGFMFTVTGFSNNLNNGTFTCTASTSTTLTLNNSGGVAQTQSAQAVDVGNVYHFSNSDIGKNAVVAYSYNLAFIVNQVTTLVPSGAGAPGFPNYSVVLSQQFWPTSIVSVRYYGVDNPNEGKTLTQVFSTPTAAGTYQFYSASAQYDGGNNTFVLFSPADVGQEVIITWGYTDESSVGASAPQYLNFSVWQGAMGALPNTTIGSGGDFTIQYGGADGGDLYGSSKYEHVVVPGAPGEVLGYSGIAHVDFLPMYLGTAGQMQDYTYEVHTPESYGGGVVDAHPITCIYRVLTDTRWGLGGIFPSSAIDNVPAGTWGTAPATTGTRTTNSTAWNWCAAQNYFISPYLEAQDTAVSVIEKWLEAGQMWGFMSEGLFKIVPLGSQSAAGNGCTWTAPTSAACALDDTCFLEKKGEDRVKIQRKSAQDTYNRVQIGFASRDNQYFNEDTQEWDQASINRFKNLIEGEKKYDFVHELTAAKFVASMRLKRYQGIWCEYTFQLPFGYSYLEVGDIVEITTSSLWSAGLNNAQLGIKNLPVRITKIVDHPASGNDAPYLDVTCEDYPATSLLPVLYNKSLSQGTSVNMFQAPGNTETVIFEATSRMTGYTGNTIVFGACGDTPNWGGCNILVSEDNSTFDQIGTITKTARIGTLASTFNAGSDPDTVNTLVVNLKGQNGSLESGTANDADSMNTLCYLGGTGIEEVIANSAASCTAANQYTMGTYIRRGLMGTSINTFPAGSLFLRVDKAVFQYQYDPSWAGKTIYFKFQSFNTFNNCAQPLSSLTSVAFTVPGQNPGTVDASSGLIIPPKPPGYGSNPPIRQPYTFEGTAPDAGPMGWTPGGIGTV